MGIYMPITSTILLRLSRWVRADGTDGNLKVSHKKVSGIDALSFGWTSQEVGLFVCAGDGDCTTRRKKESLIFYLCWQRDYHNFSERCLLITQG